MAVKKGTTKFDGSCLDGTQMGWQFACLEETLTRTKRGGLGSKSKIRSAALETLQGKWVDPEC